MHGSRAGSRDGEDVGVESEEGSVAESEESDRRSREDVTRGTGGSEVGVAAGKGSRSRPLHLLVEPVARYVVSYLSSLNFAVMTPQMAMDMNGGYGSWKGMLNYKDGLGVTS